MDESHAIADFDAIPVFDFALLTSNDASIRVAAAASLRDACTRVGFFYLRNHGVPDTVIEACLAQARLYFAQPLAIKQRCHISKSPHHRGYGGLLEEQTDSKGQADLHEAFDFSHDVPACDPEVQRGYWLCGPNAWPDDAPPGFRPALQTCYASMLALGRRLFASFALALDLPETHFEPMLTRPGSFMRLLHYPPQRPADDTIGIGAHSDYECFTILAQDDVGGLEVRNASGAWIQARPMPGTLVINIGDMMARWTNDRFASTLHRVINRTGRARYSIPFFHGIDYDVTVATLPACLDAGIPARYAPINAHDYVAARIKGTYALYDSEPAKTVPG